MLADLIPKLAVMGAKPEQPYRPRPSSAGPERCIRQMVFHGLKIPRDPLPGRALLFFDDSSWHEELTADWLRTSAYKVHSEQMEVEQVDTVTAAVAEQEAIVTAKQGEIDSLTEDKGALTAKVDELTASLAERDTQATELEAERDGLKTELDAAKVKLANPAFAAANAEGEEEGADGGSGEGEGAANEHYAEFQRLQAENPRAASKYWRENEKEIQEEMKAALNADK